VLKWDKDTCHFVRLTFFALKFADDLINQGDFLSSEVEKMCQNPLDDGLETSKKVKPI
jgi:hypothetical protein